MISQPVTIHLPASLYDRLKQRAAPTHQTIEQELLDVVTTAIPITEDLEETLAQTLTELGMVDDEGLWRAARSQLPREISTELERLHFKRQREGLTSVEEGMIQNYLRQYERIMLVRAQAAVLLQQRGYDISALAANNE